MRQWHLVLAAVPAMAAAAPAVAAEGDSSNTPVKLSIDIEGVSDYRFRGVSLSNGEPALQAEAVLEFDSGVFATAWGSTLSGGDVELQLSAGYSADLTNKLNLELAINYFAYPGESGENYYSAGAALSYAFRNLTPKLGIEYAPKQAHLRDEDGFKRDNLYAYLSFDFTPAGTPVTLTGQIGYEAGLFDTRVRGGKWDWLIGARANTKWLNFGLFYVDSNGRLIGRRGRNLADETLVASIGRSF